MHLYLISWNWPETKIYSFKFQNYQVDHIYLAPEYEAPSDDVEEGKNE